MGMTTQEFEKAVEMRQINSIDFVRNFTKEFDKFADPIFEESKDKTFFAFDKMASQWDALKTSIFKAGLGDILKNTFDTVTNFLRAIEPVAKFVTRAVAIGFTLASAPVSFMIALVTDLLDYFGFLSDEDDFLSSWGEIFTGIGAAIGFVVAKFMLLKKVFSLIADTKMFKALAAGASWLFNGAKNLISSSASKVATVAPKVASTVGRAGMGALNHPAFAAMQALIPTEMGTSTVPDSIIKSQITSAGITPESIQRYINTGPSNLVNKGTSNVEGKLVLELDDNGVDKIFKIREHSRNMEILGNIPR